MNRDGGIVLLAGFSTIMCIILLIALYLVGEGNSKVRQEPSKVTVFDTVTVNSKKCSIIQYKVPPPYGERMEFFMECEVKK